MRDAEEGDMVAAGRRGATEDVGAAGPSAATAGAGDDQPTPRGARPTTAEFHRQADVLARLRGLVEGASERVQAVERENAELHARVAELSRQIGTLEGRAEGLAGERAALVEQLAEREGRARELATERAEFAGQVETLRGEAATLQAERGELAGRVASLEEQIGTLRAERADLAEQVASLEAHFRTVQTDRGQEHAELLALADELERLSRRPRSAGTGELAPPTAGAAATALDTPAAEGAVPAAEPEPTPEAEAATPDPIEAPVADLQPPAPDSPAADDAPLGSAEDASDVEAADPAPPAPIEAAPPIEVVSPSGVVPPAEARPARAFPAVTGPLVSPGAGAGTPADQLIAGSYSLIAYPFARFSDLGQFQAAVQSLAGVHNVRVRRFAQGTLEMRVEYDGPVALAGAIREQVVGIEEVQQEEPFRLRVRLRAGGAA